MTTDSVFSILPDRFFSCLAGANRVHYAALLIRYFMLFQENARGVEREQVMLTFQEYFREVIGNKEEVIGEDDEDNLQEIHVTDSDSEPTLPPPEIWEKSSADLPDRNMAGQFLRRLIISGWLSEETLGDYTRLINITPGARPFCEALSRVAAGLKTEYESHVVAVYSHICGDAIRDNGHLAVLSANRETQDLIDSLKALSQSIKDYYERLSGEMAAKEVKDILYLQYVDYAKDVLDAAYKRLKTSDNLSRYRPKIFARIAELLQDDAWLSDNGRRFARIRQLTANEGREKLAAMLEDIRDTLRALDPLQDEIDKRNSLYARSSIQRVKALLEPDSTLAGRLGMLAKAVAENEVSLADIITHKLFSVRTFAKESLYRRLKKEETVFTPIQEKDEAALKLEEAEFLLRLSRQ
ncbi:MAG: DUF5716 family protein, partial [Spirochaetaceae bacterium]|nr:DUF5716 family protein [Spirochaetaceae bacterium]